MKFRIRKNRVGLEKNHEKIASEIGGRNGEMAVFFWADAGQMPKRRFFRMQTFFIASFRHKLPPLWWNIHVHFVLGMSERMEILPNSAKCTLFAGGMSQVFSLKKGWLKPGEMWCWSPVFRWQASGDKPQQNAANSKPNSDAAWRREHDPQKETGSRFFVSQLCHDYDWIVRKRWLFKDLKNHVKSTMFHQYLGRICF